MKKVIAILLTLVMAFALTFSASAATINQTEEIETMSRVIPEGAFLFKEGLYVYEYEASMGSLTWTVWELYSADGWCFYDLQDAENYVDGIVGGELVPENQRIYAQFMTMPKDEEYVTNNIISVPIQEG